ncbi:MarR family winged helix-turn-helix transcriptional regulator [Pseudohongiella sp.]|uniref:HTH marR-type domain-containing protein n=1 Tax=marine sediment metagenome TaxID=412755 RepID=A0A0F9W0T2_9ZZZZ|nr:MarR family winged helix-turn-helix transcriptional regulator [Pseudohongiella sp.]HDZ08309.1 MarR family transcriptional regulator [Pseudohongiella sp.]HEA62585.1 MarR family transcriptional regulator [Pseudohongiella sp.]
MNKNFDKSLGFAIHDVARLLRVSFDRQASGTGLTRAQWSVLAHLHRNNGVQQKTLACMMDITPITLARHLDRLEVDAWIERRDDPDDRRAKRVYLNPKAGPMMATLTTLGQRVRAQAMSGISPQDEEKFMQVLLQIRDNLSAANNVRDT